MVVSRPVSCAVAAQAFGGQFGKPASVFCVHLVHAFRSGCGRAIGFLSTCGSSPKRELCARIRCSCSIAPVVALADSSLSLLFADANVLLALLAMDRMLALTGEAADLRPQGRGKAARQRHRWAWGGPRRLSRQAGPNSAGENREFA